MIKSTLTLLLSLLGISCSFGQYYFYNDKYMDNDILFEAGVSLGVMVGAADVGERRGNGSSLSHYDWKSSKINASVHCSVMYQSTFEGRVELTRGSIGGDDAHSNSNYIKSKNFNYKSKIFELSLLGIFHPIMLLNLDYMPAVSPYIIAGVGLFSFYPETKYQGEWIPLRRMNTEGQNSEQYPARKQYSLRAISFPIGGGLKYELNAKYNLRFEMLYRFTTSDYLDDVSTTYVDRSIFPTDLQKILAHRYLELNPRLNRTGLKRGSANTKDGFFSINFKVGYVIGREKRMMGKTR